MHSHQNACCYYLAIARWIEEERKEKIDNSTEDGAKVLLVSHHSAVNIVSWYH